MEIPVRTAGETAEWLVHRGACPSPPAVLLRDLLRNPLMSTRRSRNPFIPPTSQERPEPLAERWIAMGRHHAVQPLRARDDPDRHRLLVGRARCADVLLLDATVSRQHAFLVEQNGLFLLQDNDSSVGTRINGERLEPFVERFLESGDRIAFGWLEMVFLEPRDYTRFAWTLLLEA